MIDENSFNVLLLPHVSPFTLFFVSGKRDKKGNIAKKNSSVRSFLSNAEWKLGSAVESLSVIYFRILFPSRKICFSCPVFEMCEKICFSHENDIRFMFIYDTQSRRRRIRRANKQSDNFWIYFHQCPSILQQTRSINLSYFIISFKEQEVKRLGKSNKKEDNKISSGFKKKANVSTIRYLFSTQAPSFHLNKKILEPRFSLLSWSECCNLP